MILPLELFEQIEYYEHTAYPHKGELYDRFTIHFKQWWRRKRVIMIRRAMGETVDGVTIWNCTPGAADLHNQLQNWVLQTYEEKAADLYKKYEPPKDGSNVIQGKFGKKDPDD